MENDNKENVYLFKPVQFLGQPSIFPPPAQGKTQASVQFIIPGLKLGDKDKKSITELAYKCKIEIWGIDTQQKNDDKTKALFTQVTFAFYIDSICTEETRKDIIESNGRLLVERFLGLLSFIFGIKLSAIHIQYTTTNKDGSYSAILPVQYPTSRPKIKINLPENLNFSPSEEVFSALFWLRRGLAERDPIENFSSLMVCLQIMANHLIPEQIITHSCPSCGVKLDTQPLSITQKVFELLTNKLGASKELYQKLWKARNAIVAHGDKPVKAEVFLELTELKFEAVKLAFNSVKLGLGISLSLPPHPDQANFVTDAFMYID